MAQPPESSGRPSFFEGQVVEDNFSIDPTIFYKSNGEWMQYNPVTKKEERIRFPDC